MSRESELEQEVNALHASYKKKESVYEEALLTLRSKVQELTEENARLLTLIPKE